MPAIHYNLAGKSRMAFNGGPFMPLQPHLLIIVPPNTPFVVEVDGDGPGLKAIERDCWMRDQGYLRVSLNAGYESRSSFARGRGAVGVRSALGSRLTDNRG